MRLVHLAPEQLRRTVERAGIHGAPLVVPVVGGEPRALARAVYCMPVVADYWTTYQWLRELKQVHGARMIAVHFRVADDEPVLVGRFGTPHEAVTAASAARWVRERPAGAEVVLPRAVLAREVRRIVTPSQLVGWTGVPEADRRWDCLCPACFGRGRPDFMRRLRGAYMRGVTALRRAKAAEDVCAALGSLEIPFERARGRIDPARILATAEHPSPSVRRSLARLLGETRWEHAGATLRTLSADDDPDVRQDAASATLRAVGPRRALEELRPVGTRALLPLPSLLRDHGVSATAAEVLAELARDAEPVLRGEARRTVAELLDEEDPDEDMRAILEPLGISQR